MDRDQHPKVKTSVAHLNPTGSVIGMICTYQNRSLVLHCLGFEFWPKMNWHSKRSKTCPTNISAIAEVKNSFLFCQSGPRAAPGHGSPERWIWSQLWWQGPQGLRRGVTLRSLGRGPGAGHEIHGRCMGNPRNSWAAINGNIIYGYWREFSWEHFL